MRFQETRGWSMQGASNLLMRLLVAAHGLPAVGEEVREAEVLSLLGTSQTLRTQP